MNEYPDPGQPVQTWDRPGPELSSLPLNPIAPCPVSTLWNTMALCQLESPNYFNQSWNWAFFFPFFLLISQGTSLGLFSWIVAES